MNALSKMFNLGLVICFLVFNACGGGESEEPKPRPRPLPKPVPNPKPLPRPVPKPPKINYCVKENVDFSKNGSYRIKTRSAGRIKIMEPVTDGCIRPIMTFCNGTGASLFFYNEVLRRFASHGYYVSSYETTQSGSGKQALQAVEYAMKQKDVSKYLVAALGHSQGGQGAASVTYELERKYPDILVASIHGQPAYSMSRSDFARILPLIKSPVFAISGSRDTVVPKSWVNRGFPLIKADKVWYEAVGATHMNPQSWFATGGLAFSNMVLFEHKKAENYFMGLPLTDYWKVVYQ